MRFSLPFLLNILFILFTSCGYLPSWDFFNPPPPPLPAVDSSEMTSLVQDLAVEWEHGDYHMRLEHADAYYNDGVHTIQLQFISQAIIEMCEARELIVDMVEGFLAKLNQDPLAAAQFSNYPFSVANLEIYITFESFFGKYVDPYYIAWICLEDSNVLYYTFDVEDNTKMCWHSRHETYATSREIALYHREAERAYEEAHKPKFDIFGSARYVPPEEDE